MTTAAQSLNAWQAPPFPVRRFTVSEYHRLMAPDLLNEDDSVELLEGWIVPKMPRTPAHDAAIALAETAIRDQLPAGWHVRVQSAITTSDSEPEPDISVVRGGPRDYLTRHPGPEDISIVIEVADSSLQRDRDVKAGLYARAGIPIYCLINLAESCVEIFDSPGHAMYERYQICRGSSLLILPVENTTLRIAAQELLP